MAVVNYDSELRRAGAHATHGWRRLAFLAQRYVLGTIGLCIMVLFVWVAISANLIGRLVTNYSYTPVFVVMGFLHPLTFLLLRRLRNQRVTVEA